MQAFHRYFRGEVRFGVLRIGLNKNPRSTGEINYGNSTHMKYHTRLSFSRERHNALTASLDEKSNLPQICLLQICCKYEIRKALPPVPRWRWPNSHKNGQIRPSPHLHWVQSCAKLILATYLHKANLMQIRFFVL